MEAIGRGDVEAALRRADAAGRTTAEELLREAVDLLAAESATALDGTSPADPADPARTLSAAAAVSDTLRRRLARWIASTAADSTGTAGPRHPGPPAVDAPHAPPADRLVNTVTGGDHRGGVVQGHTIGDVHWHAAPAPVALPTPRQLIPAPRRLSGRTRELADLDAMLRGEFRAGPLVAVVNGPAGVGKTALAAYWLRSVAADFPDGQIYVDLRGHAPEGPAAPPEALGMFLRAFGMTAIPGDPAELASLWRSVTASRRLLLMLDNAISAAQVRPLLPGSEQSVVVVTSRRRLTGLGLEGAVFHPVGVLDAEASADILAQRVGVLRTEAEPAAVRRVIDSCGGLALAVCVAAARMAARPGQPLAATAEALDRGEQSLAELRIGEEAAVQSALDASYRLLPEDAAALYRLLGVLPFADVGLPLAAAATGRGEAVADRLLETLAEASLLEEAAGGRHRFHDLVRLHARGLAEARDPEPVRTAAVRRALEWYLATATAAEELISPSHRTLDRDYPALSPDRAHAFTEEKRALAWLAAEQHHLMTAVRLSAARGWDGLCWQLVDALWPLWLRLRPYALWVEAHRLGLEAARRAGHTPGELRMLTSGATGLCDCGATDEAIVWFGQALDLARSAGDRLGEAQALHGLGQSHHYARRLDEAADWFGRALRLREEIGYVRGAALSRMSLGDTARLAGRPEAAVAALRQARADLLALPDAYEANRALALLGRALGEAGRTGEAETCLRQAAAEFEARGSVHWEAYSLDMLGVVLQRADRPDDARRAYERSVALYESVGASDTDRVTARIAELDAGPGTAPEPDPPVGSGTR
ncbi:ATP-binding protein [Streptomyces sp. NPDC088910]|uniref:ATP-binding protein n=1 Tax=Streptomyces sp. NPDC088910 TaxID=3365911 RepID=UPI0037F41DF0